MERDGGRGPRPRAAATLALIGFLAAALLVAANQLAWSRMLDGPQGGRGDAEALRAMLVSALVGVVVAAVASRWSKRVRVVAAIVTAVAMFVSSWGLGVAATTVLRRHYCAKVRSAAQCARCFEGDEQRWRCGG